MEKKKIIWIVRTMDANPLNMLEESDRASLLAEYLAANDYEVVFWGSAYSHSKKEYLYRKTICMYVNGNEKAVFIYSPVVYKKNLSPKRYIYGNLVAKNLKKEIYKISKYPVPDIIFCSWPTEQDCRVMLDYGKKYRVPVVIDARDMWPDIFGDAFPKIIRGMSGLFLKPLYKKAKRAFSDATAIFAMSPQMLDWGLAYAERKINEIDKYFFISPKRVDVSKCKHNETLKLLDSKGINEKTWNICMFSSIRRTSDFDIRTVVSAIMKLNEIVPEIRLIIGGDGDGRQYLENLISDKPYISFMGYLNREQMTSIMSICKVGLYPNKDGWGNQVGQFFSGSLPLITSCVYVPDNYLFKYNCGVQYGFGDADGLCLCLKDLIDNPPKLDIMKKNAFECYKRDFEQESVNRNIAESLENVITEYKGKEEKRR